MNFAGASERYWILMGLSGDRGEDIAEGTKKGAGCEGCDVASPDADEQLSVP